MVAWSVGCCCRRQVTDTAGETEQRLERRSSSWDRPEFEVGSDVRITTCAPSEWAAGGGTGKVVAHHHEPFDGPYCTPGRRQRLYVIQLGNRRHVELPERYLRPGAVGAESSGGSWQRSGAARAIWEVDSRLRPPPILTGTEVHVWDYWRQVQPYPTTLSMRGRDTAAVAACRLAPIV